MNLSYTTNPLLTSKYLFEDAYQGKSIFGRNATNYDALRRLSSYFKNRYQNNEKVVRCFLSIDVFASGADFEGNSNDYVVKTSDDLGYDVGVSLVDSLYNVVDANQDDGLTLTDAEGYVYCLTISDTGTVRYVYYNVNGTPHDFAFKSTASNSCGMRMYIQDITGNKWIYVPDLIENLVDNGQVMSMYTDSIDSILSNHNISSLSDVTDKYVSSARESVTNVANYIKDIFASAGFGGFVAYLSSVITSIRNATLSQDENHLIVTDNQSLMPECFLAGTYEAIINSVTLMLAALVSVVSAAAAIIVAAVGTLASFISSKVNYSYDTETLGAINHQGDLSCFPMACGRVKYVNDPNLNVDPVVDQYIANHVPFTMRIGPTEVVGSSIVTDNNTDFHYCFETHIDSVDRRAQIKNFVKYRFLQKLTTQWDTEYKYDSTMWSKESDFQDLREICLSHENTTLENDMISGVFSESDDLLARTVYQTNLFLYFMMVNLTQDPSSPFICNCGRKHGVTSDMPYFNDLAQFEVIWEHCNSPTTWNSIGYLLTCTCEWAHNNDNTKILSWANLISISEALIAHNGHEYSYDWENTYTLTYDNYITCYTSIPPSSYGSWYMMAGYEYFPLHCVTLPLSTNGIFALSIPKYDRKTFYDALKGIIAVTAVSVIVVSTLGFMTKMALGKWAASRSIETERLWNYAVAHPEDGEALSAYRWYAFKNNIISRIFGGTIYNRTNFWGGASSLGEAKLAGYAKAFLTGGAGGVIASHLLGDEADSTKKIIRKLEQLIVGS